MSSWGVKATESDYGLDLLVIIEKNHLEKNGFSYFDINETVQLLKKHIITDIINCNRGCDEEDMNIYIEDAFPYRYDIVIQLIAEFFYEYITDGKWVVTDYNDKDSDKVIKQFNYTKDDLKNLINDLRKLLHSDSELFQVWRDSDSFFEWKLHITALINCLNNHHCEILLAQEVDQ